LTDAGYNTGLTRKDKLMLELSIIFNLMLIVASDVNFTWNIKLNFSFILLLTWTIQHHDKLT